MRVASKLDYPGMLEQVLEEGGDTDTNAAIIGGIFGAIDGLKYIPSEMVDAVMKKQNSPRPEFLVPGLHW